MVELLIVVAIIGILAAIVIPEFQSHSQQAKEAVAKENLRILREAIERYALDHNGVPPGYLGGTFTDSTGILVQLTFCTNSTGDSIGSKTKSGSYIYGPYLSELPENPFNSKSTFQVISDTTDMPPSASGDYGWIYKPKTKTCRLDWPGTDTQGRAYYEY